MYTDNATTGLVELFTDLEDKDDAITCPSLMTRQNSQYTNLINRFLEAAIENQKKRKNYLFYVDTLAFDIHCVSRRSIVHNYVTFSIYIKIMPSICEGNTQNAQDSRVH